MDLHTHNEAMLLKFPLKFFSQANIQWVKLVWAKYYNDGKLPGKHKKGSFWWRDIVKLLDKFIGMASVSVADGATVLLWKDNWNSSTPADANHKLFSFAKNEFVSFKLATSNNDFLDNFNLPLSVEAHFQLSHLQEALAERASITWKDQWKFSWGNDIFSTSKAYKVLKNGLSAHPVYHWI